MPSLIEVMQAMIDSKAIAMHTAIPGEIVKYDSATGKAEVRALVRLKYSDGTVLTPPVISNVPVIMPRTNAASLTLPIAPGDPVLIVFAQWSIDHWLSEGSLVDAGDARTHAMSDAFAIPGAFSFKDGPTGEEGAVLKNGSTKFKIDDEKVAIGNATVELLDRLVEVLDAIGTSTCPNGAPLSKASDILDIKDEIDGLKGSI